MFTPVCELFEQLPDVVGVKLPPIHNLITKSINEWRISDGSQPRSFQPIYYPRCVLSGSFLQRISNPNSDLDYKIFVPGFMEPEAVLQMMSRIMARLHATMKPCNVGNKLVYEIDQPLRDSDSAQVFKVEFLICRYAGYNTPITHDMQTQRPHAYDLALQDRIVGLVDTVCDPVPLDPHKLLIRFLPGNDVLPNIYRCLNPKAKEILYVLRMCARHQYHCDHIVLASLALGASKCVDVKDPDYTQNFLTHMQTFAKALFRDDKETLKKYIRGTEFIMTTPGPHLDGTPALLPTEFRGARSCYLIVGVTRHGYARRMYFFMAANQNALQDQGPKVEL